MAALDDCLSGSVLNTVPDRSALARYPQGHRCASQPAVDDDKRTVGLRLDRMIGVGVGFTRQLENDRSVDVNLNVINTGEGKVDTGDSITRGRVVGESNQPYAFALDVAYHW